MPSGLSLLSVVCVRCSLRLHFQAGQAVRPATASLVGGAGRRASVAGGLRGFPGRGAGVTAFLRSGAWASASEEGVLFHCNLTPGVYCLRMELSMLAKPIPQLPSDRRAPGDK